MTNDKVVKILEDLIEYIDDNWDISDAEIEKEAEENIKALEFAINIIKSKKIIGSLSLNDKTYSIIGE